MIQYWHISLIVLLFAQKASFGAPAPKLDVHNLSKNTIRAYKMLGARYGFIVREPPGSYFCKPQEMGTRKGLPAFQFRQCDITTIKQLPPVPVPFAVILKDVTINATVVEILCNVRNLRDLTFDYCQGVNDATIAPLSQCRTLQVLTLNKTKVSDRGLNSILAIKGLRELNLVDSAVSEDGLKQLAKLPRLESLMLSRISEEAVKHLSLIKNLRAVRLTYIDNRGLQQLAACSGLETLSVSGDVCDKGMKHIAAFKRLRHLDLGSTKISDPGLLQLAGCKDIRTLSLSFCRRVSDVGLKHLATLKNLQVLHLTGCRKVTDAGLKHFTGHKSLLTLDLTYCENVTDAGLKHLTRCAKLRLLGLEGTKTTLAGVNDLKKSIPRLRIGDW